MKTNILLVGCGYTSVWTYRNLSGSIKRAIKRGEISLTLLSDTPYHHFHGFTGEFLSDHLPVELSMNHYTDMMEGAVFIYGTIEKVNQNSQSVEYIDLETQESKTIEYEQLVLGVGSLDHDRGVEGIAEHGLSVKQHGGIKRAQEKVVETVKLAAKATTAEEQKRLLSFVVAGGGFAGVELTGNLCEMLEFLKAEYPVLNQGYQVHLILSSDRLLPHLDSKFGRMLRYTKKALEDYKVNLHYSTKVSKVEAEKVYLSSGEEINSRVLIYAIGQQRVPPASEVSFKESKVKTIIADEYLRAEGFDNIWVGGDIASIKHPFKNEESPANALWAMMQGARIGKNISRVIKNRKPAKFAFPGMGQTGSLGKHKGVLELYNIQFTGFLAWYLRLGFFLYFYPVRKHIPTILKLLITER